MSEFAQQNKSRWQQYRALLALLAGMILLATLLISETIKLTRKNVLEDIAMASAHTLKLVNENLQGELGRFQALPRLLASDPAYRQLWNENSASGIRRHINLLLERSQSITGALDLYIMDINGLTLAASNWHSKRTFIGKNFSFRPYFQQALQGKAGQYFALGTTSGERGYYFSYPIRVNKQIFGVMVCKLKVGHFEKAWKNDHKEIIVTDQHGIVFLSSKKDWLYHSLHPLSPKEINALGKNRQYDTTSLPPLEIVSRKVLNQNSMLLNMISGQEQSVLSQATSTPEHIEYLLLSGEIKKTGWQIHILAKTKSVKAQVWRNVFAVSIFLFSLLIVTALMMERSRRNKERTQILHQARNELEQRINIRTRELQKTQSELVQASKLAALGKMAAGLSHELNQPLAAIRSYSDNAATFLQRGLDGQASANLKNIGELTDRMAHIIKHLRIYASKDKVEAGPTDLALAIREALTILAHRSDKENISIIDTLPEHPLIVHGGQVRLQQVFVNILANAFDAMAGQEDKRVQIFARETATMTTITICDNGPGLSKKQLDRIFDPFYSTKEVGEGVGLGLSISYGIIQQFGGRITAQNCEPGGELGGAALKVSLLKKVATNV